jgi:hypothetical protein
VAGAAQYLLPDDACGERAAGQVSEDVRRYEVVLHDDGVKRRDFPTGWSISRIALDSARCR